MVNSPPEQKPDAAAVANPKVPDHIADILAGRRKRIPMSTATRKMEVPAIDGWYLYWALESNIPAMMQGGYEFVDQSEARLVQTGLANDKSISGNTDLGTRVSMVGSLSGTAGNGPERAYLMKLRQEWRDEDRAEIDAKNAGILGSIFKGETIFAPDGTAREKGTLEYVRTALFNRPTRKAKLAR